MFNSEVGPNFTHKKAPVTRNGGRPKPYHRVNIFDLMMLTYTFGQYFLFSIDRKALLIDENHKCVDTIPI